MINIIEIKNKLGNGCTVPYVVWCDDGKTYVVKFPGNLQGKKALVNEFISSQICEYLELPILNYSLINVKKINYVDNMRFDMDLIEGTAFGTVYDDNALTILNGDMIFKSKNYYDGIKILIFDLLMGNFDRNKGNLLINSVSKKIIMIDHTHIFSLGTIWDEYQLPRLIDEDFDVFKLNNFNYQNIINSIRYDKLFYSELNKYIKRVKTIKKEYVEKVMNKIPEDWEINNKEKELLTNYILHRFLKVDDILKLLNMKGDDNNEK